MLEKPSSKEEEYFAKQEFKLKREIEIERHKKFEKQEKERLKVLHYMCCPKCGRKLIEISYHKVLVDKCSGCHGVWLDAGELEKILADRKPILANIFKF